MLQPLRANVRRQPTVRGSSIPAPTKGWNTRDPLDGMDAGYAPVLDNLFPSESCVCVRDGHSQHATGVGTGVVETLMEYSSGGTRKLLAFGNSAIYDATAAASATSLATGMTNNRWQGDQIGVNLIMANGADTPRKYNGSAVTTTGPSSGPTVTDLVDVHNFKERLLFIEDNSSSFWYGGIQAITGAFTEFDLGQVHAGGKLMAIGTLTNDGGSGIDDLAAFVMESGAVLIYSGTDPGDAAAWSLVGVFMVGPPVGRRCLMQVGSDLVVITKDGYVPLLKVLQVGRARQDFTLSDVISPSVNDAAKLYGGNFGWQAILYPKGRMALFNVPLVEGSQSNQHIVNTTTGAWCRFKGMDAVCWGLYNDDLYFGGSDGTVYKADDGQADNGSNIEADGQTAYQHFGGRGTSKRFTLYRPIIGSDSDLPVSMGLGVDFEPDISVAAASSVATAGSDWDVGEWDVAEWAGGVKIRKEWQSANNIGMAAAIRLRTSTKAQSVKWYSSDVRFEVGTGI